MNKIFVLLPVFNRLDFTKRCLKSFKLQTYKNFEVILIDSDSDDNTTAYVRKYYPYIQVVNGTKNWWWTKSMQEGLDRILRRAKRGDFVLEMNNDCYFESDYLKQLINSSKRNKKSIIGSLCVRADKINMVVEAGIRIDWNRGLIDGLANSFSNRLSDYQRLKIVDRLDALPGKGTLIPIEFFKKNGGFEVQRLPHYIADYELTNRAKRVGYKLMVEPKALVRHFHKATGLSSYQKNRWSYREALWLLFSRKSMNNVFDWINFVNLACPRNMIIKNYLFVAARIASGLFWIFPLYYLREIINKSNKNVWNSR